MAVKGGKLLQAGLTHSVAGGSHTYHQSGGGRKGHKEIRCRNVPGNAPEQGEHGKDGGYQDKDQGGGIIAASHKKAARARQNQAKSKKHTPALPPLQTELAEDHAHAEEPERQGVGSAVPPEDPLRWGGEILYA